MASAPAAATSPPSSSEWVRVQANPKQATTPTSPKMSSPPSPTLTTQPSSRIPIHASKNLTITAGLRWDIFGRTQRASQPPGILQSQRNQYGERRFLHRRRNLQQQQQSLSLTCTNLARFWTPPGVRLAADQPLRGTRRRGIYYGPSTENVGSAGSQHRWILFADALERHLF